MLAAILAFTAFIVPKPASVAVEFALALATKVISPDKVNVAPLDTLIWAVKLPDVPNVIDAIEIVPDDIVGTAPTAPITAISFD